MANCCIADYEIRGDKLQLDELFGLVDSLMNGPMLNEFHHGDIVDLVEMAGGDGKLIPCRKGEIVLYSYECDCLLMTVQSAWCEPYEAFEFLQRRLPKVEFRYTAEEEGCEYYVTNAFVGLYKLDSPDDSEYYSTLEQMCDAVSRRFGRDVHSVAEVEALFDDYAKEHPDDDSALDWAVHKFKVER